MTDTRRMIIAFVAIMVVLLIWQFLTPRRPAKKVTTEAPPTTQQPTTIQKEQPPLLQKQILKKSIPTETEVILENQCIKITFSSFGGTIKSVYLKKYKAELIPAGSSILETELMSDSVTNIQHWQILFQDDSTVVFENEFRKTYKLDRDYSLLTKIERTKPVNLNYKIYYDAGLAQTEANKKDEMKHFSVFYKTQIKTNKKHASKLKPTSVDTVKWIGLKSKYFAAILSSPQFNSSVNLIPLADGRVGYVYSPSLDTTTSYIVYFGPLHYDILRSYKLGWEAMVDLGWTRIFSVAILKILMFLHSIFRNYGIAIIVFSIIMKAIFYPLTRMSNKQMLQMQKLQPKIEELKKKYKNEPQTLNRETMQLYRLYKINPFSGCLPLIFQLPIFWALYSVLQKTIELRQANFVFWIKDLSLKDPYYILPILMGVSFLIQNFLTSADKRNMALMIFMPIFLTVIFLNFPSGLQLYWLFFNLLSIVESIITRGGLKWKTQRISATMKQEA